MIFGVWPNAPSQDSPVGSVLWSGVCWGGGLGFGPKPLFFFFPLAMLGFEVGRMWGDI